MNTIALIGGEVIDGKGGPPSAVDVLIRGDRIAEVAQRGSIQADENVDCSGLLITPGFIDIHSHSDLTLLLDPRASSAVAQGVTLEVIGNCGHGCAPIRDINLARRAMYGPIPEAGFFGWRTMSGYLQRLQEERPAINVAALVPNGQLRLKHLGIAQRPAQEDELKRMCRDLENALDEGAFGFSTGLEYVQERFATREEIGALCAVVAKKKRLYATHTRDRDSLALAAIEEAIDTATEVGVRLQVSHITPRGGMNDTEQALRVIDEARRRGLDVGFDMHTRLFGFTHLQQLLPLWVMEGAPKEIQKRLGDPFVLDAVRNHPNIIKAVGDWSKVVLMDCAELPHLNGATFTEIAARLSTDEFSAAMRVLSAEAANLERPMVLLKTYSEEVLQATYQHTDCMIGSDATSLAPDGPLAGEKFYGAYTWTSWFLRRMVREKKALTLPEAVRRLTSLPADWMGLSDRGCVQVGFKADIAVLDWNNYGDRGSVEHPSRLAQGIRHLFVNGVPTIKDGAPTGQRAGEVLRC
jgi:N-acyl-D-aspartate/D-glutamate deacylase